MDIQLVKEYLKYNTSYSVEKIHSNFTDYLLIIKISLEIQDKFIEEGRYLYGSISANDSVDITVFLDYIQLEELELGDI